MQKSILKIYSPPPYERLVILKAELNRKSFSQINWHNALKDLNVATVTSYMEWDIYHKCM